MDNLSKFKIATKLLWNVVQNQHNYYTSIFNNNKGNIFLRYKKTIKKVQDKVNNHTDEYYKPFKSVADQNYKYIEFGFKLLKHAY